MDTLETLEPLAGDKAPDRHEADTARFTVNGPGCEDRTLDPIPTDEDLDRRDADGAEWEELNR